MCSFRKDVWQLTVAWHGSFGLFQSHIGGLTNGPDVSSWISLTKTKETPTNFKRNNMFIYWRGGGRERNINMREKHQLVVSHTLSYHGSNQQPRYVPWLRIEPPTFWCMGWYSNQLNHNSQGNNYYLVKLFAYTLLFLVSETVLFVLNNLQFFRIHMYIQYLNNFFKSLDSYPHETQSNCLFHKNPPIFCLACSHAPTHLLACLLHPSVDFFSAAKVFCSLWNL